MTTLRSQPVHFPLPAARGGRLLGLLAAAVGVAPLGAQIHKVAAPETVTRAVAVYEWTGDLTKPASERLVPVSLYINGEYEDAGTYYSRPIPLALLNGNVYSLEKSGEPEGNVTIDYARHLQSAAGGATGDTTALGWFGYGKFAPLPPPPKVAALKPSADVPAIVSSKHPEIDAKADSDRPTFAHRPAADGNTAADATKKPSTQATTTSASVPDDPDRPHISKGTATSATSSPAEPADTKATQASATPPDPSVTPAPRDPSTDTDRPTLRHRDPKQAEADRKARSESGVTPLPGSLATDPDRPTMHRGTPAEEAAAAPQLSGLPADLHQEIAVSDATNRDPHLFARAWANPGEQAETQKALAVLAKHAIKKYAAANALRFAPEAPAHDHRSNRKGVPQTATDPADERLGLHQEQIAAFTLSYGGLPTFVYSATGASDGIGADIYATIVAQRLPSGELQVALTSVTDSSHLDRTPWYRLVDAVDPDAGHRASLLFEMRSQNSRQFALYRVLSANADQIFITHTAE